MSDFIQSSRRTMLQCGLVLGGAIVSAPADAQGILDKAKEVVGLKTEDVTPPEDLMREHGVLDRVLLIYEAAMHKFLIKEDFDPKVITNSANVIRDFIENYHEKSEEDFIFPRFRKAGKLLDLIATLKVQHDAGRRVTDVIFKNADESRSNDEARRQTVAAMQSFITMYRPHAAREDTDLFPQLRKIVSAHEFAAIGEDMEKQEHQKFGVDGFEKVIAQVAGLERGLGIDALGKFTPA